MGLAISFQLSALSLSSGILAIEQRHEAKVVVFAVGEGGFAQRAFINEAEALIEMTGAGVGLEDIEKEAVGVVLFKDHADELGEDLAAEAALRRADGDALELDGAGGFGEAAEDGVGGEAARDLIRSAGVDDEVAGVGGGERGAVTVFAPLADEGAVLGERLDGEDGGDVGERGGAEEHGEVRWIIYEIGTTLSQHSKLRRLR